MTPLAQLISHSEKQAEAMAVTGDPQLRSSMSRGGMSTSEGIRAWRELLETPEGHDRGHGHLVQVKIFPLLF